MDINPYAPSQLPAEHHNVRQDADEEIEHDCWRDEDDVVLRIGADLPPRCVYTNRTPDTYVPLRCTWNPPQARLTTWLGPWMPRAWRRNKTEIDLQLPQSRYGKRYAPLVQRLGIAIAVICALLTLVPLQLFRVSPVESAMHVCVLLSGAMISLAVGLAQCERVKVHDVHDGCIWLRGAGWRFRASLPKLPD